MKTRNEADTRADLIDPKLKAAGWSTVEGSHIRREVICPGRLIPGGKRGDSVTSDYILVYQGRKLAAVEAKKERLSYTEGVRQAKDYAQRLQCRIAYATNGHQIYQINMLTGEESLVDDYLSPEQLWALSFGDTEPAFASDWRKRFSAVPLETKGGSWLPRYYQDNAINNSLESIAQGGTRILLTLATGTGKTAIAFQIAWKLFHSRWSLNVQKTPAEAKRRPRILFLADRNILADQAFNNFAAFGEDALARIEPEEIKKKGRVPKNASVFFTIFQTFMSGGSTGSPTDFSGGSTGSAADFDEVAYIKPANAYMYILQCADGSFYTGSTKDLSYRLVQHKKGEGAQHTKVNEPVKLIYCEIFEQIDKAFDREQQLKKWSRAKKIALINKDIERLRELSSWSESVINSV